MALGYQNPFYLKQAQQKQQSLYNGKVLLENHDPPAVYDSEETLQLAQKYDARVQNFEIQFLKEAAKFVRDFKYLAKEADEYLAKHKALELEIERLLRAVATQDIMFVVQNLTVVETSDLHTELEHMKERFGNCIIKKENEYAKLWNDWYKKCEECKYDKISNDKAYNDIQKKYRTVASSVGRFQGIDPRKTSREDKFVPINKIRARVKTNLITVSQPHVITRKYVNTDSNGLSSTGVDCWDFTSI
ncbi:hypothetical protein Tco_0897375 [Tanacetum coccineum]